MPLSKHTTYQSLGLVHLLIGILAVTALFSFPLRFWRLVSTDSAVFESVVCSTRIKNTASSRYDDADVLNLLFLNHHNETLEFDNLEYQILS